MIKAIDHLIVVVEDLDSAIENYTNIFGFGPSWRGVHSELGTANALFALDNLYLELLAANSHEGTGALMVKATLEQDGEGLAGLVFGTSNISAAKTNLEDQGIKLGDLTVGTGFDNDQGLTRTWKNLFLPFSLTRGLFTFLIEHETGSLPKVANVSFSSVQKLDHVVVNTNDPDGLLHLYKNIFGIRLALDQTIEKWGGRMLFFRLNETTIEVIGKLTDDTESIDKLWGLAWTVSDIKESHKRLSLSGVEITPIKDGRKNKTLVCTLKSHTCGVPTLLIQQLS